MEGCFYSVLKRVRKLGSVSYVKRLFQKELARSCADVLVIPLTFTVQYKSENLNPAKYLILKDLLFEQFFPTKPGTQVQL